MEDPGDCPRPVPMRAWPCRRGRLNVIHKAELGVFWFFLSSGRIFIPTQEKTGQGTSLAAQQLGLRASAAGTTGSVPGQGTETPQASRHSKKKQKKKTKEKPEWSVESGSDVPEV